MALQIFIVQAICRYYSGNKLVASNRLGRLNLHLGNEELLLRNFRKSMMNAKTIGYWATVVLFSVAMGFGGVADLMKNPEIMESMKKLGYPDYLATILGFWKVCGVIVILLPGLGLLKEWAYAGFLFDLTGASASHAFAQDNLAEVIIPLVILAIGGCSWMLRPESRRVMCSKAMIGQEDKTSLAS